MKKFIGVLVMVLILFVPGSFNLNAVGASDNDMGNRTIGGVKVGYTNALTYTDVRCGMNTRAHYRAHAAKNIKSMTIDWDIKNPGGHVLQSSAITRSNVKLIDEKSKDRQTIATSTGRFNFEQGGSKWSPTSRAYHCKSWSRGISSNEIDSIETLSDDEKDILKLQQLYNNIKRNNEIGFSSRSALDNSIKDVVQNQLSDNITDISTYEYEDGTEVSLEDFDLTSVKADNSITPTAEETTFSNPDANNSTIIEIEIQEPVYQNGEKYKITGYVVLIDKDAPNLESGIIVEPF